MKKLLLLFFIVVSLGLGHIRVSAMDKDPDDLALNTTLEVFKQLALDPYSALRTLAFTPKNTGIERAEKIDYLMKLWDAKDNKIRFELEDDDKIIWHLIYNYGMHDDYKKDNVPSWIGWFARHGAQIGMPDDESDIAFEWYKRYGRHQGFMPYDNSVSAVDLAITQNNPSITALLIGAYGQQPSLTAIKEAQKKGYQEVLDVLHRNNITLPTPSTPLVPKSASVQTQPQERQPLPHSSSLTQKTIAPKKPTHASSASPVPSPQLSTSSATVTTPAIHVVSSADIEALRAMMDNEAIAPASRRAFIKKYENVNFNRYMPIGTAGSINFIMYALQLDDDRGRAWVQLFLDNTQTTLDSVQYAGQGQRPLSEELNDIPHLRLSSQTLTWLKSKGVDIPQRGIYQWLQSRKALATVAGLITAYSGYRWFTSSSQAEIANNVLINKTGAHVHVTDEQGTKIDLLENGTFSLPDTGTITISLANKQAVTKTIDLDEYTDKRTTHYLNIIVTKRRWVPGWLSGLFSPLTYSVSWMAKVPTEQRQ